MFSCKYPGVNILLTEITVEIECISFFALCSGEGIQNDEKLRYVIKCITPNKFSPFHPMGTFIFCILCVCSPLRSTFSYAIGSIVFCLKQNRTIVSFVIHEEMQYAPSTFRPS